MGGRRARSAHPVSVDSGNHQPGGLGQASCFRLARSISRIPEIPEIRGIRQKLRMNALCRDTASSPPDEPVSSMTQKKLHVPELRSRASSMLGDLAPICKHDSWNVSQARRNHQLFSRCMLVVHPYDSTFFYALAATEPQYREIDR